MLFHYSAIYCSHKTGSLRVASCVDVKAIGMFLSHLLLGVVLSVRPLYGIGKKILQYGYSSVSEELSVTIINSSKNIFLQASI